MLKIGDITKCKEIDIKPSGIAIGKFGVFHKGHEQILEKLKVVSGNPIIFSFAPSPAFFFSKNKERHGEILKIRQRAKIANSLGISMFIQKFTKHFSEISPEDFVSLLVQKLKMKHLVIGEDFLFGKNKSGNVQLLQSLARKYNFNLEVIPLIEVKTTNLRQALENGEIEPFNENLAFNSKYTISGIVAKGAGIAGSILGFKTANIPLNSKLFLPKFGVYKCKIFFEKMECEGIANIGIKPTLSNKLQPIAEVHIFNFNQDIYGKQITIELLTFIREEKKFNNLEDLKTQIKKDISGN